MNTQALPKNVPGSFVARDFPPYRGWMPMNAGQLQRSLCLLHEEIRLDEMRVVEGSPKLELADQSNHFAAFEGVPHLMWTHRCNGIGGDGSRIVEYRICEIGKPNRILVEGELTFRRCP